MIILFIDTATTDIFTLSLHDALPIWPGSFTGLRIACGVTQGLAFGAGLKVVGIGTLAAMADAAGGRQVVCCLDARMGEVRSEEHTSELQSRRDLVCRLLLEKKKVDAL